MKKSILTLIAIVMISMVGIAQYCTPTYNPQNGTLYIKSLTFNTINNTDTTGYANGNTGMKHYLDYPTTKYTTTIYNDSTYKLDMTFSLAFFVGVWIDYNGDGDFGDAGECVYVTSTTKVLTVSSNITIPSNATLGSTKMRVIYNGSTMSSADYCTGGSFMYSSFIKGETQDYTITIAKSITTGISETSQSSENEMLVYPNPSSGNVNIEINIDKTTDIQITIINAFGQLVKSNVITEVSGNVKALIDLQGQKPGMYIVMVNYINSNKNFTKRLMIQ